MDGNCSDVKDHSDVKVPPSDENADGGDVNLSDEKVHNYRNVTVCNEKVTAYDEKIRASDENDEISYKTINQHDKYTIRTVKENQNI